MCRINKNVSFFLRLQSVFTRMAVVKALEKIADAEFLK